LPQNEQRSSDTCVAMARLPMMCQVIPDNRCQATPDTSDGKHFGLAVGEGGHSAN
jgi:hypothetical protein